MVKGTRLRRVDTLVQLEERESQAPRTIFASGPMVTTRRYGGRQRYFREVDRRRSVHQRAETGCDNTHRPGAALLAMLSQASLEGRSPRAENVAALYRSFSCLLVGCTVGWYIRACGHDAGGFEDDI